MDQVVLWMTTNKDLAAWVSLLTAIGAAFAWWRLSAAKTPRLALISAYTTHPRAVFTVTLENTGGGLVSILPRMRIQGLIYALAPYDEWCTLHPYPETAGDKTAFLLEPFKRKVFYAETSDSKSVDYLKYLRLTLARTYGRPDHFHYSSTATMRRMSLFRYHFFSPILRFFGWLLMVCIGVPWLLFEKLVDGLTMMILRRRIKRRPRNWPDFLETLYARSTQHWRTK